MPPRTPVPWIAAGTVGQTSQVITAAAMPPRCHQLAGPAPDERTCHHWTAANPYATTTGAISTGTAMAADAWLATMAPPISSAMTVPKITTHAVITPAKGCVSSGIGRGG